MAVLRVLHRISRVYAVLGTAVSVFGFAAGAAMGLPGEPWLVVSTAPTLVAALLWVVVAVLMIVRPGSTTGA